MAQKLVDLTGATVTVPAGWSATSNYGIFNINGYIEYHDNNTIYRTYNYIQFAIGYNVGSDTPIIDTLSIVTGSGTKVFSTTNLSFMIEIYDGTDVTNQNLIQWLLDNDATIEGGVWEEERKPIIIKNPIIIIGSKAKKVVVDNVNMTIDVWTKEVPSEEKYFYVKNSTFNTTYTFILPSENITFKDYIKLNGAFNDNIDVYQIQDINNSAYLNLKGYQVNPTNFSIYLSTSQNTLGNALANVTSSNIIIKDNIYTTSGSGGGIS